MEYEATIGLEIHAELKTATKMFCNSKNDSNEKRPNWNVCPICMAHPGCLPVVNGEAVRHVLRVGLALGGQLADYTEFDRKNYFYPDLPKGYQISQFAYPLVSGGTLKGVEITRIHLEEDTASSVHNDATNTTMIDFNRAGVPLMELVTEPVIKSAEEAGTFARELQLLLRYLDVSEANMEKGEMRVEANISVAPRGERGTKVEIKNINSFNVMERAVGYEIERQKKLLGEGGVVVQETRGWDDKAQKTFAQRTKEGSADYRYFPDPDLPSLRLSAIPEYDTEALRKTLPELPEQRRKRYAESGIKSEDAEMFTRERALGDFFENVTTSYESGSRNIVLASNYIANDLVKIIRDTEKRDAENKALIPISADNFRKIIDMVASNRISSRGAKDLIALSIEEGKDPETIAKDKGLLQDKSEKDVERVVAEVIEQNPKVMAELKAGKETVIEYLVGQCMKALRGGADPVQIKAIIRSKL